VADYACQFISIRSWGILSALISFVAAGTYRGVKDTVTPLHVSCDRHWRARVCVCVCVHARARARACVCVVEEEEHGRRLAGWGCFV